MARMQKSVPEDLAKEQAPDVIEEIANVEENLEKEIAEAVRPLQSPPRQIVPLSADSTTELFKETTGTESVTEDKVSVGNLETGLAASQASKSELKLSDQLEEQEKAKDDKMSVERLTKVEESLQMTDDKILVGMDEGVKDVSEELLLKRRPEEDKTQELHLQNLSNLAKSASTRKCP